MTKTLTTEDMRDLLTGFAAAIEFDQILVDALPPESFHPDYSPDMWRMWHQHRARHSSNDKTRRRHPKKAQPGLAAGVASIVWE